MHNKLPRMALAANLQLATATDRQRHGCMMDQIVQMSSCPHGPDGSDCQVVFGYWVVLALSATLSNSTDFPRCDVACQWRVARLSLFIERQLCVKKPILRQNAPKAKTI